MPNLTIDERITFSAGSWEIPICICSFHLLRDDIPSIMLLSVYFRITKMGSHRIQFYATRNDLEKIIVKVEAKAPALTYAVKAEVAEEFQIFKSLLEIPNLGKANDSESIGNTSVCIFLAANQTFRLQITNSDIQREPHLYLRPAGVLNDGIMILGELNVLSNDPGILNVFELFRKEIRRQSVKIDSVVVCREAENLLDKGWTLTPSASTFRRSILRRPSAQELKLDEYVREICVDLKHGTIKSIEISSVLDREFSFEALSPDDFEKRANARLQANVQTEHMWFDKLLKSLRNLHIRSIDSNIRPPDICWGITFRSTNKTRTIYLSSLGTQGIIEGNSFSCDKRLLKIAKSIS